MCSSDLGMPKDMVQALSQAVGKAARDPDMRRRLAEQGAEPVGSSAEEFSRIMRDEVAKWAEVVKVSGAKAE